MYKPLATDCRALLWISQTRVEAPWFSWVWVVKTSSPVRVKISSPILAGAFKFSKKFTGWRPLEMFGAAISDWIKPVGRPGVRVGVGSPGLKAKESKAEL